MTLLLISFWCPLLVVRWLIVSLLQLLDQRFSNFGILRLHFILNNSAPSCSTPLESCRAPVQGVPHCLQTAVLDDFFGKKVVASKNLWRLLFLQSRHKRKSTFMTKYKCCFYRVMLQIVISFNSVCIFNIFMYFIANYD